VTPSRQITILLAEDHTIVRQGLRALLNTDGDLRVVGEARTGREAVKMAQTLRPDVIVMDIAMPQLNGLEATRQILLAVPATKVLILSAHNDDEYVERVLAAGAAGYLLKQSSANMLAEAIRAVVKGHPVFSPSIARRLGDKGRRRRSLLTSREEEVLQLVAEGAPNKQVAAELGISIKTVEKHRQHLMDKLDIHDTAGLTRYAIAAGVVESSVQKTII
jgi:DNA-binding NarL/FixJ family response regulator